MSNVLTFPVPSAGGSLDHYIQAVNRFPLLTPEQETQLARKFRTDNDDRAAGIIDTFSEKVLAKTSLFTTEHIA